MPDLQPATFWNDRVGRVERTREGQALRWWYGPAKADPNPHQKWCHDCLGVVEEDRDRRWCRLCKASQALLDAVAEQAADAATRELEPTWVRYPVGIRSVADLRVLVGEALAVFLADRALVDLPAPDDDNDRLGRTVAQWSLPTGVVGVYPDDHRPIYTSTEGGQMTAARAEQEAAVLLAAARTARQQPSRDGEPS